MIAKIYKKIIFCALLIFLISGVFYFRGMINFEITAKIFRNILQADEAKADSGVGSLRYVGYYWAASPLVYGDYIDEIAPYTNIIYYGMGHSSDDLSLAKRAKDNGLKILLEPSYFFVPPNYNNDGINRWHLASDWQTKWNNGKAIVHQMVNLGNVYAFYVMDEPNGNGITRDEQNIVVSALKTEFPNMKTMITENAFAAGGDDYHKPPDGLDIYSIDGYDPPLSVGNMAGIYQGLKNYFFEEIWVTAQSARIQDNPPTVQMQQAWFDIAKSDSQYKGLFWFLYPNVGEMYGAINYPDILAYHRQVGLQILCANNWESNPVCGLDGKNYPNPDQAKCAGTMIKNYGSCANARTGDFNGDGYADILTQDSSNGQVNIKLMSYGNTLDQGSPGTVSDLSWQIKGVGDFNGDGKSDILWQNINNGQPYIWFLNGLTVSSQGNTGSATDSSWQIKGVGDFNGDGKSDILWQNAINGTVQIWLINGTNAIGDGSLGIVSDLSWQIKGVGDFNGDGKSDILWQNAINGAIQIWLADGTTVIGNGSPGTSQLTDWRFIDVGDFNHDGKTDILFGAGSNGDVNLGMDIWFMDGTNRKDAVSPAAPNGLSVY